MNKAQRSLRDYQEKNFEGVVLTSKNGGFDLRAYPETAEGVFLDRIGEAIEVEPRFIKDEGRESCKSFRKRILIALETPDPEEDKEVS